LRGVRVRAVLLCNPQNPYGRCYTPRALEGYAKFCEAHDLHLISDEIYALSTFASADVPAPAPFASILSLDLDALGVRRERVHVLYGMSKDFGSNGFRAGALHSWSARLRTSLCASTLFMLVSSPAAGLWAGLLGDARRLDEFVALNRRVLGEAYEHMTRWLRFHGVPYIPAEAGQFVMADFTPVLADPARTSADGSGKERLRFPPESSLEQREALLAAFLTEHAKVVVGKGAAFHMPHPGWLRLTFSVERARVDAALRRMEEQLEWAPWDGLCGAPAVAEPRGDVGRGCIDCLQEDGTLKGCGPR